MRHPNVDLNRLQSKTVARRTVIAVRSEIDLPPETSIGADRSRADATTYDHEEVAMKTQITKQHTHAVAVHPQTTRNCQKMKTNSPPNARSGVGLLARVLLIFLLAAATVIPGAAQSIYVSNNTGFSGQPPGQTFIGEYQTSGEPVNTSLIQIPNSGVTGLAASGWNLLLPVQDGNSTASRVSQYNISTASLVNSLTGFLFSPIDVAVSGQYLFVLYSDISEGELPTVGLYNASTGAVINPNVTYIYPGQSIAVSPGPAGTVNLFMTADFGAIYTCSVSLSNGTGCTNPTMLVGNLSNPLGMAVYGSDLFVVEGGENFAGIQEFNTTTGVGGWTTAVAGGPVHIAVSADIANTPDPVLLVTLQQGNAIAEYDAITGKPVNTSLVTGLSGPTGIAVGAGSCVAAPENLVAWYPFDYAGGTQVDFSENNNNATAYGTSSIAGEVSNALLFDGRTDYVQAPNQPWLNMGTGNLSIDAWVKVANSADDRGVVVLVDKRDSSPIQGYHLFLYEGRIGLQLAVNNKYSNFVSNTAVPADNQWHLVTVTVVRNSHTGGVWYLDGVPIDKPFDPTPYQSGSLDSTAPLDIGVRESGGLGGGGFFKGGLDELEIFNRALSPGEVLSLALAGPSGKCKADWPQFRYESGHTGFNPYESILTTLTVGAGLQSPWVYPTNGFINSSPAVANGMVYFGSNDGNLYAVNASDGHSKWSATTGSIDYSSPAVANGIVYVGSTDHHVYAFNAITGAPAWNKPFLTNNIVNSSPAVANADCGAQVNVPVVFVGSYDSYVYALNASTGAKCWSAETTTQSFVRSSPAVADVAIPPSTVPTPTVYVGGEDGYVYALNGSNKGKGQGAVIWKYPPTTSYLLGFNSSPAVANANCGVQVNIPVVFIGNDNGGVYALNASTGALCWSQLRPALNVLSSPAVANAKCNGTPTTVVYVGSDDSNLYALDANNGAVCGTWSPGLGNFFESSPAVADGVVYIGNDGGTVYAFDASNVAAGPLWDYTPGGSNYGYFIYSSPAVANGVVYVGSDNGSLYAFKP